MQDSIVKYGKKFKFFVLCIRNGNFQCFLMKKGLGIVEVNGNSILILYHTKVIIDTILKLKLKSIHCGNTNLM